MILKKAFLAAILLFASFLQTLSRPSDESRCQTLCGLNNPCPIGERCIMDACSFLCYKLPPQDPRCPQVDSATYCEDECTHRPGAFSDCGENEICCFNGCGNECMNVSSLSQTFGV